MCHFRHIAAQQARYSDTLATAAGSHNPSQRHGILTGRSALGKGGDPPPDLQDGLDTDLSEE